MRIADTIEPGLVAFRLAPYRRAFYATPAYLGQHGTPQTLKDLAAHNCLIARGAELNASWQLQRGTTTDSVRASRNFVANNGELLRDAALADLGIAIGPRWQIEEDLRNHRLIEVLGEFVPTNRSTYAILPRQGALTPKVRAFVDFLKECFADIPGPNPSYRMCRRDAWIARTLSSRLFSGSDQQAALTV